MEEIITIKKYFKPFYRKKTEGGHGQLALPTPPNEGNLNTKELAIIRSLLNQEEPIVKLELEQENEEEYQVEEPLDEESQINVMWDFYTNENDDDEGDSMAEIHINEIHTRRRATCGRDEACRPNKERCPPFEGISSQSSY